MGSATAVVIIVRHGLSAEQLQERARFAGFDFLTDTGDDRGFDIVGVHRFCFPAAGGSGSSTS